MKFLHISDLHITNNDDANTPVKERLTFIAKKYPEHYYLISGDIIDNEGPVAHGSSVPLNDENLQETMLALAPQALMLAQGRVSEILSHTEATLKKAVQLLSILPAGKLIMCAGNHDYALWGNYYLPELKALFDEILFRPLAPRNNIVTMGYDYNGMPAPAQNSASGLMSYFIPGVCPISVVSLSTSGDVTSINPHGPGFPTDLRAILTSGVNLARGRVGADQIRALEKMYAPEKLLMGLRPLGDLRILMMHHHPFLHTDKTMILENADAVMTAVRTHVDLIVFGHRHKPTRYEAIQIAYGGIAFGAVAADRMRTSRLASQIEVTSDRKLLVSNVPIA
jgi:predicted phosphohydrolase